MDAPLTLTVGQFRELIELFALLAFFGGAVGALLWPILFNGLIWAITLFARLIAPPDRRKQMQKKAWLLAQQLRRTRTQLRNLDT